MYIAVRADLPYGAQLAQTAHAAFQFCAENPEQFHSWHTASNYVVVVAVPDENALTALASRAILRDIGMSAVREPDLDDELTAIALEHGDAARALCANLPLAGKPGSVMARSP